MTGPATAGAIVDVHCHVLTPSAQELLLEHYTREHIVAREPYDFWAGAGSTEHNRSMIPSIRPKMVDPVQRLADMDRMGIDVQVLATFVTQYSYWADPALGAQLSRLQNAWLAEIVSRHPDRFAAIGTVPLQDVSRAVDELDHVVEALGFKGVQIGGNVNGRDLDDPRFEPFFARAEALGAVVLIHPNGFDDGRRLGDYFLVNVIGNPLDSTVALTRLIFGGVLERHPDLRLCVVHGGGFLPVYSARMDHAFEVRPECRIHIDRLPSEYLRRVYFDTMVFSPTILRSLIDFAGADHVLLGTDYPFDMGEDDPVGLVGQVPDLDDEQRALVRGGNAVRLFGLDR